MTPLSRRSFLRNSLATSAGLALGGSLAAIEPIVRKGPAKMALSLAAYSYRQFLTAKAGQKPAMTLLEFVDLAAGMGLKAVEPTSYYFPETTPEYLDKLKAHCDKLGVAVSGSAIGNNFTTGNADKRKEQLALTRAWIERTAHLGGKTLRIFAGSVEKGDTEDKARARCIEAIEEACEHAAKHKVYLALENHGGITSTSDQLLTIVKAVKKEWFGVNLDTGNFRTEDPYADMAKLAPYAVTVQIKTEIQRQGKPKEEADLKRIVDILRGVNYQGYVALEYEASEDPKVAIPRHIETLKKLLA